MDPFLDLIQLLRPRATLWSRIDATGQWSLSFRKRHDLLFCWVREGQCLLLRPRLAPVLLQRDDFVLIRTSTPFTLASDRSTAPLDSETLMTSRRSTRLKLGSGRRAPVILRGGRFVFDTANEDLLTGLLPQLFHLAAGDGPSSRVHSLLQMNEAESLHPRPGSDFVIARLMDLILVEILRAGGPGPASSLPQGGAQPEGLLAGLADPLLARALSAMHRRVAHPWTVAELARLCGVSRSAFAVRFREAVGKGPIEYLLDWRMALAKDGLRSGSQGIAELAFAIGFQSSSAFSTSFSRHVGMSPRTFARSQHAGATS